MYKGKVKRERFDSLNNNKHIIKSLQLEILFSISMILFYSEFFIKEFKLIEFILKLLSTQYYKFFIQNSKWFKQNGNNWTVIYSLKLFDILSL